FQTASSPAAAQALIRNLTYRNSNTSSPSLEPRTLRITLLDGDLNGESIVQEVTVHIEGVNDEPEISGTPEISVHQDSPYSFVPTVVDVDGDALTFSIQNKPDWADFDTTTGELSGTPTFEDVG